MNKKEKISYLVEKLNEYRYAYYNYNDPMVTDEVYDRLFDELAELEKETGIVYGNSPTNTVGFKPVSELKKINHSVPLLSLDKTKSIDDLIRFISGKKAILMYKLDGLTVRLDYEDGKLTVAGTRGDGAEGEDITHNIPAMLNVPLNIPYKGRLSVSGEAYIETHRFDMINKNLPKEQRYKTPRNLAAGSIRAFDPQICRGRCIKFMAFNVLEGMDEVNSRNERLDRLSELGFDVCPKQVLSETINADELAGLIEEIKNESAAKCIPIDGAVIRFDDIVYSKSLGRTGHHYKDGLAYKYEDELFETKLREVEWTTSRNGSISPVAVFDTVMIDGCAVSRATLHNVSYIKKLELNIGDRILISKRHMIIPAVEENLDRDTGLLKLPDRCPQCGAPTELKMSDTGNETEKLYCTNPECGSSIIKQFVHFADKDSMNIEGLAESTISRFIEKDFISDFSDLYSLEKYKSEIVEMDGFGEKSYERIISAVEKSKTVQFNRFLRAMDIPLLGRHASKIISDYFEDSIDAFENAVFGEKPFCFAELEGIGDTLNQNIYEWFDEKNNYILWNKLKKIMNFEKKENKQIVKNNELLTGKTVVVTGKVEGYTRSEMDALIVANGGIAGDSVTKNTDYLVIAEKPGSSKLKKAEALGTKTLTIDEFMEMIK